MARKRKGGTAPGDYEIGYGRPPKEHRFKAGTSGNPHGRPKKTDVQPPAPKPTDLIRLILEEAKRHVPIRNGDADQLDTKRAVIRATAVAAIKGGSMAQKTMLHWIEKSEAADRERRDRNQRIIQHYRKQYPQLAQRYPDGIAGTSLHLPHPDDMVFDDDSGDIEFIGPFTKMAAMGTAHDQFQRDQLLPAVEDCYDMDCEPTLKQSIRDYADGLYNAALYFDQMLPARLRRNMSLSRNPNWREPFDARCNAIVMGLLEPFTPGFLRALDADRDAHNYFAGALFRFQGYNVPYLNRSRHYQPAFGLTCTSRQRTLIASMFETPRAKRPTRALLLSIGRKFIVPPHVIANARVAAARIDAGGPVDAAVADFLASLEDANMPKSWWQQDAATG